MSETARSDRPRKKKKKQKPGNGLMIGLIAGGVALVIGVVVFFLMSSGGGDPKKEGKAEPKEYVRPMDEKVALARLENIARAYDKQTRAKGKAPASLDDLRGLIDPDELKMIDGFDGWIEMGYHWKPEVLPQGADKTIVAHEKLPFKDTRLVLTGDGKARAMPEADFGKWARVTGDRKIVPGPLVTDGGKTRIGRYIRRLEDLETRIVLQKVGQSYLAFELERNRGPKALVDLDCRTDARVQEALDPKEGWLEFAWGVGSRQMPAGPAATILGYEREPVDGMRYVIFGNGSSDRILEEDFAKAPKAKGK